MSSVYADLADALNALPNGFPRTETGSDLRLLEFMYSGKKAELASRLTNAWDSVDIIAGRLNISSPIQRTRGRELASYR